MASRSCRDLDHPVQGPRHLRAWRRTQPRVGWVQVAAGALDNWSYIQYIAAMTISKTFHVQRSGSFGEGLQAGSKQRSQRQRQDSGWDGLARWFLAILVALGLSVQVEAREAGKVHAIKANTVVAGRIVGVSDGDTVTLLTDDLVQQRIRLRGIDAPEKAQAFGNRSKQALSALVFGRRVSVAYSKVDRYDRWVGRITVGTGDSAMDVSREMIAQGMAWHYVFYEREQPVDERVGDAEAEQVARLERRGLWRDEGPVAPWEFRKAQQR